MNWAKIIALCLGFLVYISGLSSQVPVLNEFMSSNSSALQDYQGDYSDWIEIFNSSNESINLSNYYLSDDENDVQKWIFPSIELLPSQYLIVFASGKDIYVNEEAHTNFKIKQSGENLILSSSDGEVLQNIQAIEVPTDKSYSCIPDGDIQNMQLSAPTPYEPNHELYIVYSSHTTGYYSDSISVSLLSNSENCEIRYTLNGSSPISSSLIYTQDILFNMSNYNESNISYIPTTPLEGPWPLPTLIWKEPVSVNKCHVLRYACFVDSQRVSEEYCHTYFVDSTSYEKYSFPVISLITDSLNLFQYDSGIYIPGAKFDELGFQNPPEGNYNERGREWERKVNVSFLETDGVLKFQTYASIRMRGGYSPSLSQKSMGLYFRDSYGLNNIQYPVFSNSSIENYKRLILRSSGNDYLNTHFRDALLQELLKPLDLELQNFRPSIVFINGEYWGIHNIREKYDDHHFRYHFNVDQDSVNILNYFGGVEEGSSLNYPDIVDMLNSSDMSQESSYQYIDERVDISNMIDFLIAEIYYANYDWPCKNYKKWRIDTEQSKWRFLIHDLDLTFGTHENTSWDTESLYHALEAGDGWPNCASSNLLFRKMMENENFVNEFLNRFKYHLKYTFSTDTIIDKIDYFTQLYEPEIEEHIDRWSYPSDLDTWYSEIQILKDFAINRPDFIIEHIKEYFQLDDFDINDINDSIFEYSSVDFRIFPNPNNVGELRIENLIRSSATFQVNIFNNNGIIVYSGPLENRRNIIDLSGFTSGFYIVKIFNSNYIIQHKLVIVN